MRKILTAVPRLLATVLLLASLLMFGVLIDIAVVLARGGKVAPRSWLFPLIILAIGAVLMWLLARKHSAMQLYIAAFALWLLTAGYYVAHLGAMLP